ncbi:hypothetical protein O181_005468 [Austropuccinia psidii MF-1]|uniref:Uncharacterized protein n=1 Tax=Austropuccinia psidii MF-1 TaxID=1389203 RepID=A0A9Q3BIB1_9BASI|nr:hypothetical protein [Austropuccinia psidii MF-1]
MGFKFQKPNQPNPPQQNSPIPSLPQHSRTDEPPIPGPSPSSKPDEDVPTREPEPEVALTQSMEEPFDPPSPCLFSNSVTFPFCSPSLPVPPRTPIPSSPHSHNDACQEFTDLRPTLMIPQAIVHKSINQILLEHCQFLHIIPFVDSTYQNEMHQEFWEELNSLLAHALEAYPREDITGIVSKYLERKN